MIAQERRMAASLLAVIVFLIAFGSLYPFSFSLGGAQAAWRLGALPRAGTTYSDAAANVLLYLPLGTCLAWLLVGRLGAAAAVIVATLSAALLSYAIESAQLYETRRVASLADFACNTAGAFAGACLALSLARTRSRLRDSPFAGLVQHPVAAALLFSWVGYRLAPFAPLRDAAEWAQAVAPLANGAALTAQAFLAHALAWLVLVAVCGRLAPARPLALTGAAMGAVLAGRVLLAGSGLELAEIAGMAAALFLARPLCSLSPALAARLLAAALVVSIAWDGLAPFDFQLAQDRFALLPFGESLTQYRAANLPDMFLRCFTNGALVWLLAMAGLPVLAATGIGAGAVFLVEFLQTWLPGQTAEITDPLLAISAGGLIAVFERAPAR
jgi:VanZ family protein